MRRSFHKNIIAHLGQKQISLLVGQRGVGKSYLLKDIKEQLNKNNIQNASLDLEQISVSLYINDAPEKIFRFIPHPDELQKKPLYLFLDNIHHLKNPALLLNYLYDYFKGQIKVIAASSFVFYYNEKGEDLLPGKKKIFLIHGFDFNEFLKIKNRIDLIRAIQVYGLHKNDIPDRHEEIQKLIEEYITFGSLPAIVLAKKATTKIKLLEQYKQDIIKKEGVKSGVEHEDKYALLITELAQNLSTPLNKNQVKKNANLSSLTAEKYLDIFKKNGHLVLLPPFNSNKPKELTNMPKLYFNDLGIRNAFIHNFSDFRLRNDKKQLLDNFIFLQIRQLPNIKNLFYWKSTNNILIDLVVATNKNKHKAILGYSNIKDFQPLKFKRFISYYPQIPLSILTTTPTPENWIFNGFIDLFMESLEEEVFDL